MSRPEHFTILKFRDVLLKGMALLRAPDFYKTHVDRIKPIYFKKRNSSKWLMPNRWPCAVTTKAALKVVKHGDWIVRTGHSERLHGKRRDADNNFLGKVFSIELNTHSPDSEYL